MCLLGTGGGQSKVIAVVIAVYHAIEGCYRWTVQSTVACATNTESARIPPPSSSTTAGLDDRDDQGQQDEDGKR